MFSRKIQKTATSKVTVFMKNYLVAFVSFSGFVLIFTPRLYHFGVEVYKVIETFMKSEPFERRTVT